MSEFDDNPFADPFAEPSIQQATNSSSVNTSSLENYDPFSPTLTSTTRTNTSSVANSHDRQPAVMTPTSVAAAEPPPYTQTSQQQINAAEFQRRQEELDRKAEELARREEELRAAGGGARANNWPPLPSKFPVGPCFYQDINVDIPLEFQKIVRMLYYLWMFHVLMLLLNVLGGLAIMIGLGEVETFGFAILYLFLFTPFSYLCWFRPVYKAFRSDSSFNFMVFFFVFFFQMVVSILSAIGIPSLGSCGILMGIKYIAVGTYTGYVLLGVLMIILGSLWACLAVADCAALFKVHRIYRSTGASFAKAQAEFTQGVMRNEHVRNVATNAASSVIQSQFAQSPGSTGSGSRF